MATKKKSSKKFSQKVQNIIKADISRSLAITSILLNVLFLVSILVITSTDTFDRKLFVSSQDRYCSNAAGVQKRVEELGSKEAAAQEWQIDCVGQDFYPYYKEAVDKFRAANNEQ